MDHNIYQYIATDNKTVNDYQPGDIQKLQYFHNLFDRDSKLLYHIIQDSCDPFEQAAAKMMSEYSSETRENIVDNTCKILDSTLTQKRVHAMQVKDCKSFRSKITTIFPQRPNSYKVEERKVEQLCDA